MKTICELAELGQITQPVVLAIGSFDGVHRGHAALLEQTKAEARKRQAQAWVLTFDPHPAKILVPDRAPALITSTEHKLRLIAALGIDGCVLLPFTRDFAALEPEAFLKQLTDNVPNLQCVVVGVNWTFGRGRRGNAYQLKKESHKHGFDTLIVEPVLYQGRPVSSSRIREAVSAGRFDEARAMLGRAFSILGSVVRGRQIGRQLGFPTVNLDPHNEVRPPSGVYAVWIYVQGVKQPGAAFLADASFAVPGPSGFLLEAHILGFTGDLYGQELEVEFVQWIRPARKYDSAEKLKSQIARDVAQVECILRNDVVDHKR